MSGLRPLAGAAEPSPGPGAQGGAHAEQLKTFQGLFMEQVSIGDLLFHGDQATQGKLRVKLSNTGWACAMCHIRLRHPRRVPEVAGADEQVRHARDMINWCIEKPNQGEKIDPDGRR